MPDAASLPGGGRDCALITASGLQLALGNAPPSRECADLAGASAGQESPTQSGDSPFAKSDYFVIGAAVLILLSLLATFLLGARGSLIAAGGSLIAACLLAYDILMRIPQAVRAGPGAQNGPGPTPEQIAQIIQIQPQIGFWLVLVALLAAIALNVMASRQPSAAVPPPPPAV